MALSIGYPEKVMKPLATIYVIDDDLSVRRALRRQLEAVGYQVEAHGLAEDVRTLEVTSPCCFVVDVHLQDMSAAALADLLDRRFPQVPVVYITAHVDDQTRALASRRTVVELLHKPFDEHLLLRSIERALHPPHCGTLG